MTMGTVPYRTCVGRAPLHPFALCTPPAFRHQRLQTERTISRRERVLLAPPGPHVYVALLHTDRTSIGHNRGTTGARRTVLKDLSKAAAREQDKTRQDTRPDSGQHEKTDTYSNYNCKICPYTHTSVTTDPTALLEHLLSPACPRVHCMHGNAKLSTTRTPRSPLLRAPPSSTRPFTRCPVPPQPESSRCGP